MAILWAFIYLCSRDIVVSIVNTLWAGQPWVRIPTEATDLSPLQNIQTSPGVHPASYSMGTGDSLPGNKAAEVQG
jgi:hypothetical protein